MSGTEIARGDRSGGATTSHTIVVPALQQLLAEVGTTGSAEEYERAVLEDNVLGKSTAGARRRTFRYLRELYLLRNDSLLFRALGDLWSDDPSGRPLLAGLCALARDPVFRASAEAIVEREPGDGLRAPTWQRQSIRNFLRHTTSQRSQRPVETPFHRGSRRATSAPLVGQARSARGRCALRRRPRLRYFWVSSRGCPGRHCSTPCGRERWTVPKRIS